VVLHPRCKPPHMAVKLSGPMTERGGHPPSVLRFRETTTGEPPNDGLFTCHVPSNVHSAQSD
jgi:hypothetical protein